MKRLAIAATLVVLAAVALLVVLGRPQPQPGRYRVDAVFDNSRGLVPGQLVEVAGGRVGTIKAVTLTSRFKARVQMAVDPRFAPFKADATCSIRAQGLIAENYVQCDPGTAGSPKLGARGKAAPTVPVARTTQPVSVSDLFQIWTVPTSERLTVLLSELGIASAGRGEDFNDVLRRANPALGYARRTIATLQRQRADLRQSIDSTGSVVRDLAHARTPALLAHSASVLARTRSHSRDIELTIARLPLLLRRTQPALEAINTVIASGTPLLKQLDRSAPDVNSLSADAGPLVEAARPTLRALGPVLDRGARTFRHTAPLTKIIAGYARKSLPSARLSGRLLSNLRAQGFTENLLQFFYNAAAATARFDSTSHILPAHIALNQCIVYSARPVPGCSANYGGATPSAARAHKRPRPRTTRRSPAPGATTPPPRTRQPATQTAPPAPPPPSPSAPGLAPHPAPDPLRGLLDYLLR